MISWCDALNWVLLAEGAVAAVLGVALSIIAEYVPKFATLAPRWKRLVILAVCVAIPVAALLLAWYTGCVAQPDGEAVWQAVLAGGIAFATSQLAHTPQLSRFARD